MKKLLFFSICLSGLVSAQIYSNPVPVAIPDNYPAGVRSSFPVGLNKTINDPSKVTINVDLSHTWCGDIIVSLELPNSSPNALNPLIFRLGKTANLLNGSNANFLAGNVLSFNSTFTNTIVPPAGTNSNIPAGNYKPTGNPAMAGADVVDLGVLLNNVSVFGNWSLRVVDEGSGDTGTLNNWSLVFDAGTFLGVDTQMISNPGLSVMQNPFRETLNLKVNNAAKNVKFDIYSVDGKKVYSYNQSNSKKTTGDLQIPTANWTAGIYILTPVVNGEKLMNIKLLKK